MGWHGRPPNALATLLSCATAAAAGSGDAATTVDGLQLRDASQLQAAVNASIAAGEAGYTVAAGAYYFDDGSPLLIYRAKRWSLTAAGRVELWFRVSQRWRTGGVLIKECEDVAISGLVVDYDPPTHYQGTVLADGPYAAPRPSPPAPPGLQMVTRFVRTDAGFPEPHKYVSDHSTANDPSDNYVNAPAIWPKHIGYGCNRTLGCPGHGAGVLLPQNASLPRGVEAFQLLGSARPGDKVTISMRKGITWHVENSTRVTSTNISVHSASLFGLSEFDGGGAHKYEDVWLGRRRGVSMTQLCGRAPGRLCFGILASNADAFHSSGCKVGPKLRNVTLSNNFDDFMNVHSRMQLLGDILSPTSLIILDPRLTVARGVPDDTPYGAAETMPNARAGDVLEFHALNSFTPRGSATIASLERLSDGATIAKYGAAAVLATSGGPPHNMTPSMAGGAPDVGQICGAFATQHRLPQCASRVWRVTLSAALPAAVQLFDLVSLRGWDNAGLEVRESRFFGGIDGVHSKSNGALFEGNAMACTGFDVSPWQHYLEGPPHLKGMTIRDNVFPACGGLYGTMVVNCSGNHLPKGNDAGFCTGPGTMMAPGTCDMASMVVEGNRAPTDCTIFNDPGAQSTCCSACGVRCRGCGV